jgi:RING finger protein 121
MTLFNHTHHVGNQFLNGTTLEDERDHARALLSLFLLGVLALQVTLYLWRHYHRRSYQRLTLFLLFLLPPLWCLHIGNWRVLLEWALFTGLTARFVWLATRTSIAPTTPRKVYNWFWTVHRVTFRCVVGGVVGVYTIGLLFDPGVPGPAATLSLLFASMCLDGLYLGVLNRDCAEHCATEMNNRMGFSARKRSDDPDASRLLPTRSLDPGVCAICSGLLARPQAQDDNASINNNNDDDEPSGEPPIVRLDCQHTFHEQCIKGWAIIGKKDTCPYCAERVSNMSSWSSRWDLNSQYGSILDMVRYCVVWAPLLILGVTQLGKFV